MIVGSRIFLVSTTIFHSSLVEPSSRKTSMWGMTLKAICLGNFDRLVGSPTKMLRGLLEQFVHRRLPGAGNRLVGRDDDALDLRCVVQRLQRNHQLRGRAVGVGDDVLLSVAGDRLRVHLRHDQRHVRVHPVKRAIVDHRAAGRRRLRRVDFGDRRARCEQRHVPAGEVEMLEVPDVQVSPLSPKSITSPVEREEATAATSSSGNCLSARMLSSSRPTLPVAPTTAIR